jgi:putative membrane protein
MKILALAVPLALALSAPAYAQAMSSAEYIAAAGAGDTYEIQSSKIVLETTQDPKVKSFATMMVTDHTKSTMKLKAAALASKAKAPKTPMLTPTQTEMLAQLKAETGPARDMAYVAQQKAAHNQALAIHKAYAEGGRSIALKTVANGVVPVVEHHIDMLKTM